MATENEMYQLLGKALLDLDFAIRLENNPFGQRRALT